MSTPLDLLIIVAYICFHFATFHFFKWSDPIFSGGLSEHSVTETAIRKRSNHSTKGRYFYLEDSLRKMNWSLSWLRIWKGRTFAWFPYRFLGPFLECMCWFNLRITCPSFEYNTHMTGLLILQHGGLHTWFYLTTQEPDLYQATTFQ